MICVTNLGMQYGAKVLFRNASINFDPGKRYGLVGANGAGKSTLLRILTNDENPTEGKVSVPKELKLGFLRQDHFSYEDHVIIHVVMQGKKRLWQAMEMKEELLAKEEMDEKTGHQLAELEIIIDQMLIDIIAEYPDMGMALQHFRQGAQFVPVIAGACGVAGRIKNKPFRAWSDCRLERFGR